jgi:hypothetical protein
MLAPASLGHGFPLSTNFLPTPQVCAVHSKLAFSDHTENAVATLAVMFSKS